MALVQRSEAPTPAIVDSHVSKPRRKIHFAFIVAFITFWILFCAGGVRSTPALLTVSFEREFGWTRALIAGAVAINVLLYGIFGPFAAVALDLGNLRYIAVFALGLLCVGMALATVMNDAWHLYILQGLIVGFGTGVIAPVFGKVIVNRWFHKGTGMAMGLFSASAQTGQVILAPLLGYIVERHSWRVAAGTMSAVSGVMMIPVAAFLYNRPVDAGVLPYGADDLPTTAGAATLPSPGAADETVSVKASGMAASSSSLQEPAAIVPSLVNNDGSGTGTGSTPLSAATSAGSAASDIRAKRCPVARSDSGSTTSSTVQLLVPSSSDRWIGASAPGTVIDSNDGVVGFSAQAVSGRSGDTSPLSATPSSEPLTNSDSSVAACDLGCISVALSTAGDPVAATSALSTTGTSGDPAAVAATTHGAAATTATVLPSASPTAAAAAASGSGGMAGTDDTPSAATFASSSHHSTGANPLALVATGTSTSSIATGAPHATSSSDALIPLSDATPSPTATPASTTSAVTATGNKTSIAQAFLAPLSHLFFAMQHLDFWLISGSFTVCGATTIGLIGSHLIPACMDHGMAETASASFLAGMGVFDVIGTLLSGYLTDRFDARVLLAWYYGLRGAALIFLPWAFKYQYYALWPFAVVYGLDWIATVPPTTALCTACFGKNRSAVIFGWCFAFHQIGASIVSAVAGSMRTALGTYYESFWMGGGLCIAAAFAVLAISDSGRPNVERPAAGSAGSADRASHCSLLCGSGRAKKSAQAGGSSASVPATIVRGG